MRYERQHLVEDFPAFEVDDIRRGLRSKRKLRGLGTVLVDLPDDRTVLLLLSRMPSSIAGDVIYMLCRRCGRRARVLRVVPASHGLLCVGCVVEVYHAKYASQLSRTPRCSKEEQQMSTKPSADVLEDFIVQFVRTTGRFVPFHVLTAMIGAKFGFFPLGDAQIVSPDNPKHVVWSLLDPVVADAIISAVSKKRIFLVPALAEQYSNTGFDLREHGFAVADYDHPPTDDPRPTWAPMTLSSRPLKDKPPPFMTEDEVAAYR